MKAIADTGFLVAFANRHDHHHEWAVDIAESVTERLVTCDAVLAETAFHLGSSALVLALLHDGLVRSTFVLNDRAYFATGAVGSALRGPQAGSGGPLPHSS